MGLIPSLYRFGKLYINTWTRELKHQFLSGRKNTILVEGSEKSEPVEFSLSLKRMLVLATIGVVWPSLMIWNVSYILNIGGSFLKFV